MGMAHSGRETPWEVVPEGRVHKGEGPTGGRSTGKGPHGRGPCGKGSHEKGTQVRGPAPSASPSASGTLGFLLSGGAALLQTREA